MSDPTVLRETFHVGHMAFELIVHPRDGVTFALMPKYGTDRRHLFSGHVEPQMDEELQRFADRLRQLKGPIR